MTEAVRYCQGRMALSLASKSGEKSGVEDGSARAVSAKEPPGRFHQVDSLAAWTLEPPRDVASSGSASPASTRPWLRWLRVVLMEDRSLAVAAGCPWRSILNGWVSWQPG